MTNEKRLNSLYEEIKCFDKGGNAEIFTAIDKSSKEEVIIKKIKSNYKNKKYRNKRFINEINIMKEYKCSGILPIINNCKKELWYSMPKATCIAEYIENNNASLKEIVNGIVQIAETLHELHEQGVSHRDIKPANLYYYNNRYCIGDFGIADFPDNAHDLTVNHAKLGPTFTIAPEMKRSPKTSDGRKADVYSLAKTLWALIYRNDKGFEGVYNFLDMSHSLHNCTFCQNEHLVELEELLTEATDNAPENRPDMLQFKEKLLLWLEISDDFNKSQISDWTFLSKHIFPVSIPSSSQWNNMDDIIKTLKIVSLSKAYNHMLFPNGGGLDLQQIEKANEEGCIYLYFGACTCVVKPKSLRFETFANHTQWNYLFLELEESEPIFDSKNTSETLVEDIPGNYVSAESASYGVYDYESGKPLPQEYKIVERYLRGNFLIVFKNGPYNQETTTYDGRQNNYTADEFRAYISNIVYANMDAQKKALHRIPKSPAIDFDLIHKLKEFLSSNIFTFDYSVLLSDNQSKDSNIKFSVKIRKSDQTISEIDSYKILCTDKKFWDNSEMKEEDIYYFYNREDAISFAEAAQKQINDLCIKNGFDKDILYHNQYQFEISLKKIGKPLHLFTKQEIRTAMANADDRCNNQLVIDENGYAKILQNSKYGCLYPVRHETWHAGNNYVGKYSSLETLEMDYLASLEGWLLYLETGKKIYKDYTSHNKSEEELIAKIKSFY